MVNGGLGRIEEEALVGGEEELFRAEHLAEELVYLFVPPHVVPEEVEEVALHYCSTVLYIAGGLAIGCFGYCIRIIGRIQI